MAHDWIKMRGDSETLTTFCERCGKSFTLKLPIGIPECVTVTEAFAKQHFGCRVKTDEANERARDGLTFEYRELDQR